MKQWLISLVFLALVSLAHADSIAGPVVFQNEGFSSIPINMQTTPTVGPTIQQGSTWLLCFSFPVIAATKDGFWSAVFFLNGIPYTQTGFMGTHEVGDTLQFAFALPNTLYHATYWRTTFFEGGKYQDGQGNALVPVPEIDTGLMSLSGLLMTAGALWRKRRAARG